MCIICNRRTYGYYGKRLDKETRQFRYYWRCGWCESCIAVSLEEYAPLSKITKEWDKRAIPSRLPR